MAARAVVLLSLAALGINALVDSPQYDQDGPSTSGSNFMIAFLPNRAVQAPVSNVSLHLIVTTREPDPVTFTVSLNENLPAEMRAGFPFTTTVTYGQVQVIALHEDMAPRTTSPGENSIERSKAIHLVTEGGRKVSVKGFVDDVHSSDGFLAISCDGMYNSLFSHYEYIILAGDQRMGSFTQERSSMLIVPCEDETNIRIEASQTLALSGLVDLPQPPPFRLEQGSLGSLTAHAGQTVLISHSNDLTGTVLRASKPLAVFSGRECGSVVAETPTCYYFVEQMPPGLAFGHIFFVVPFASQVSGDQIRVATLTDETQVVVTCVRSPGDIPSTLQPLEVDSIIDRGERLTYTTPNKAADSDDYKPSYCCIDATEPVVVAQYATQYSTDASLVGRTISSEAGDSFMSIIPAVSQYANNYTITSVAGPFPDHFVNLAISAAFFNNSANSRHQIRINDDAVSPIDGFIPFYCSHNEVCGYGAQVAVNDGIINIYHERPDYGLLVSYYAYQEQHSYAIPQEYELNPISGATPTVFFDPTSYYVNESDGIATIIVTTDVPGGPQDGAVEFYTEDDSATAPGDYTASGALAVNFEPGQLSITVSVAIRNDNMVEQDETFFGRLCSTGVGDVLVTQDRAQITIINDGDKREEINITINGDEETGAVSLSPLTYEILESERYVNVLVTKNGNYVGEVQGTLSTLPGSASVVDYDNGAYQFVIQPEQQQVIISIPITDDDTVEQLREQFSVSISIEPQLGLSLSNSQGAVTIVDDDVEIGFNPAQYQITEGEGMITFEVKNRNPDRAGQYTIQFSTIPGSATESTNGVDGDYVGITEAVTFSQGTQNHTVEVAVINDGIFESTEDFATLLTTMDSRVNIFEANALATVTDDDSTLEVSVSPLGYEVDEAAGVVRVTVQKSGVFPFLISGSLTTSSGTAFSSDFTGGTYSFTIEPNQQHTTVSIPIINDDRVEQLREQFSLSLTVQPQLGLNLGNSETTVTIIDDDGIVISLEPSTQDILEGSDATFRILGDGISTLPYSIIFETVDGTAQAPGDYSSASLTLTQLQLQGGGFEIKIPVLDDDVVEGRERFQGHLQLTSESQELGVVSLGQSEGGVTIIDDDTVDVGFAPSLYFVNEDGNNVIFFINNRNPDMEREVIIEFATNDGTAIDGSDYIGKYQSVTFQPGQSLQTIQVMLIDDNVYEGLQEFSANLTTTDSGVNIFEPDATAQITDDDEIIIQFNPSSYTVTESGSTELIIQKIGMAEEAVTVVISSLQGTASNADFTQIFEMLVEFGPSEFEKRVLVQTTPDTLLEGREDFTTELAPVSDRIVIAEHSAIIIIEETTNVIVEFQPNSYLANEEDGVVNFVLVKRTPTTHDVSVQISTMDGTATSVSDYTPLIEEVVTFESSETFKSVMVSIQADNVFEGSESFTVVLSLLPGSNGTEIGQQNTATTTITDDLTISFASPVYTTLEESGVVEVCLTTSSVLSEPLIVVLLAQQTLPIDATDGSDFSGGEYRVELTAGASEQCTDISIIDDSIALEGDELFVVGFDRSQLHDGVQLGISNITTVRIIDNDEVSVFFEEESYQVTEGDGSVSVCVRREGEAAASFSVSAATSQTNPVQAEGGRDYRPVVRRLTFRPDDERQCFELPILTDQLDEEKEDFITVVFSAPENVLIGWPFISTISILDANVVTVNFGSSDYSVQENKGSAMVCLTTSIGSERLLNVIVATAPKTASAGVDYDGSSRVVAIPPSPGPGGTCFEIEIIDDSTAESDEEFLVNFQISAGSDAQIGNVGFTCVRIIDDDEETAVLYAMDRYTVSENEDLVSLCVERDGDTSEALSVQLATRTLNPVDAIDDMDYRGVTTTVIFESNKNRTCFDIQIINDQLDEETELFSVEILSVPSDSGVVISTPALATVSIIDDDVTINFGSPTYTIPENGGSVAICLNTSDYNDEPLPIIVSTTDRTTSADEDYIFEEQVVTIPISTSPSEFCFDIAIRDDNIIEPSEEFVVTLEVPPDTAAEAGPITTTTVTITDDDGVVVMVGFSSSTYTVPEDVNVDICLTTNIGNDELIPVLIFTAPKSATPGKDYNGLAQRVNIPASVKPSEACFEIAINDDSNVEGNEEFLVAFQILSGPSAQPGSISFTCVTIMDNDEVMAVVEFEERVYTVVEDEGTVEVCLRISGRISTQAVVQLFATAFSAEAGLDFVPGDHNLVSFQPSGDSVACTNFEILDDLIALEDVEIFLIDVRIVEGPAEIGLSDLTVVIIEDDDVVTIQLLSENEIVLETDGTVHICLTKDLDTDQSFQAEVTVREIISSESNSATAGSDFIASMSTITFGARDREACTEVEILNDDVTNEAPEVFSVEFKVLLEQDEPSMNIINPSSTVTIIDDDVVPVLVNDTVVADPLFTAPVSGGAQLCFEIRGEPDAIFNLVSDKCTIVNAAYESMNIAKNGNIIGAVGIRAADASGNCHNIEIRLSRQGASLPIQVLLDGVEVSGIVRRDAVRVRRYQDRVRVSVPNCELIDLVMWVMYMELGGQDMLKYVIMRGSNLAPTSHGLIGQFWNVPVNVTKYDGPLRPEYEPFFDRDILYLLTVTPISGKLRSFLGELHELSWDRKSGPCYYTGDAQGGRTAEREENESVIEGRYTDYQVNSLFDEDFVYSQFEDRCN